MKINKIITSILLIGLLNSCIGSLFTIEKRDYNYEYKSFAKKIDFKSGNWLLTPSASTSFGINEKASNDLLKELLISKLGNRLKIASELKDENNKYLIPFDINFDNIENNFDYMKKISNCDYIISSKIYYLDDTNDSEIGIRKNHKRQSLKKSDYKSACKISIIVHDLKTEKEIFNLDCLGSILVNDDNQDKIALHQTSKSASLSVMKKIIKKIK